MGDVGEAKDASQLQYNIVRIDGQKSAYIPIMKQGGDTNTIQVVDDVRNLTSHLFDLPAQLKTAIVFDQSVFVKQALKTVLHEGMIGLVLTSLMILIFLGSMRATFAVLLSIPISALATFVVLYMLGSTDQYDDPGRPGAGVLARHRQFRHLARKHLSPPGNGLVARRWPPSREARR